MKKLARRSQAQRKHPSLREMCDLPRLPGCRKEERSPEPDPSPLPHFPFCIPVFCSRFEEKSPSRNQLPSVVSQFGVVVVVTKFLNVTDIGRVVVRSSHPAE